MVPAEAEGCDALRQPVEEAEFRGARSAQVAELPVKRPLPIVELLDHFRDDRVQVRITLAVTVSHEIDRLAVHRDREVGAVVEIEAADEILVRLAVARVLGDDDAGHHLEQLAAAEDRPGGEFLLAGLAFRGGGRLADEAFRLADDDERIELLRCGGLRADGGGEDRERESEKGDWFHKKNRGEDEVWRTGGSLSRPDAGTPHFRRNRSDLESVGHIPSSGSSTQPRRRAGRWQGEHRRPSAREATQRDSPRIVYQHHRRGLPGDGRHFHFYRILLGAAVRSFFFGKVRTIHRRQRGLEIGAFPRHRDGCGDSVIRRLADSFPAEDHHAKEHQRPGDELEQGQQVERADSGGQLHGIEKLATT